ncbi:SRPBCC family protein [Rhodococcus sp. G-MC3]|uniref:type II toxin-antitoxin system Rv0910 family toxin n=1 Tax=Rhodococcus sp. G-MC3 TaxID=3046209 RepID=UPI0024BB7626|nr:SRPBCC family protein [Rhodococcus sp. G-MC3]MDJ0394590.1 SRPBCC family protein [Rhodococcus sp. G-MC3]
MATIRVSVDMPEDPQGAWDKAAALDRFDEWMTIHGGWCSPPPKELGVGTEVESLVKVKGFKNTIQWTFTEFKEPELIEMSGHGKGGIKISLTINVRERKGGSQLTLDAYFGGGVLFGPVGKVVAKALDADVKQSVANLAALR